MQAYWKKPLLLSFFFAGILFVDLCCEFCGENVPYFDYQRLLVFVEPNLNWQLDIDQFIVVSPDSITFVAEGYKPTVTNMAYGTSCEDDGDDGPKYYLDTLIISSNQAFDVTHPAGSSLNDIFYSYTGTTPKPISSGIEDVSFYYPYDQLYFYTPFPSSDTTVKHTINISFWKSNNQVASGSVDGVVFR
jgi:hypothetical protein